MRHSLSSYASALPPRPVSVHSATRTTMPGPSLVFETKATLLKITMLPTILVLSLTILTGSLTLSLIAPWGVCGLALGVITFNAIRRLHIIMLAMQYSVGDAESAQPPGDPVSSSSTLLNIESELPMRSVTCALQSTPAYCTPLEMLNKLSSETSESDEHDARATFATVVEGSEDDCTFATSPFTSPPMYTMEIFVCQEETVVYEDFIASIPSGTPSPLILSGDLPVPTPNLTELTQYCETAIMESNMRDMELL
ncbi:hypothetical protein FRC11_009710 [Ceratobasidium sp. 423]|nr:hypothetical protein FRC11_009710 [Ceratobasidium sp. 423]